MEFEEPENMLAKMRREQTLAYFEQLEEAKKPEVQIIVEEERDEEAEQIEEEDVTKREPDTSRELGLLEIVPV